MTRFEYTSVTSHEDLRQAGRIGWEAYAVTSEGFKIEWHLRRKIEDPAAKSGGRF